MCFIPNVLSIDVETKSYYIFKYNLVRTIIVIWEVLKLRIMELIENNGDQLASYRRLKSTKG